MARAGYDSNTSKLEIVRDLADTSSKQYLLKQILNSFPDLADYSIQAQDEDIDVSLKYNEVWYDRTASNLANSITENAQFCWSVFLIEHRDHGKQYLINADFDNNGFALTPIDFKQAASE